MVDVDHREGIRRLEAKQSLVKGAARRQRGEFILIGKLVGSFDDGNRQNQRPGGEIGRGYSTRASKMESQNRGGQRPKQAAFHWFAKEQKTNEQHDRCACESDQRNRRQGLRLKT